MKNKTKKTIVIVVSSLMIILILTDLVFSTRFFIMHWKKRNPPPIIFNEGPNYPEPICNLVLKTTAEDRLLDIGLIIVKNLRSILIEVEMKVVERGIFSSQLNVTHDYDLFLISLNTSEITEQLFWNVSNYNNPTNLNLTIPYVMLANNLLVNATNESNPIKKRDYLLEFQDLAMDKLVCLFPIVTLVHESYNQSIYLGFNLQRPFVGGCDNYVYITAPGKELNSVASGVRKTICYTIDREDINYQIFDGEASIIDSIILPYESYWINNDLPIYNRNADLAFEWLNAAGYLIMVHCFYDGEFLIYGALLLTVNVIPCLILVFLSKKWKKYRDQVTLLEEKVN